MSFESVARPKVTRAPERSTARVIFGRAPSTAPQVFAVPQIGPSTSTGEAQRASSRNEKHVDTFGCLVAPFHPRLRSNVTTRFRQVRGCASSAVGRRVRARARVHRSRRARRPVPLIQVWRTAALAPGSLRALRSLERGLRRREVSASDSRRRARVRRASRIRWWVCGCGVGAPRRRKMARSSGRDRRPRGRRAVSPESGSTLRRNSFRGLERRRSRGDVTLAHGSRRRTFWRWRNRNRDARPRIRDEARNHEGRSRDGGGEKRVAARTR